MKLLFMTLFLTSCVASLRVENECKQINETMKICRDMTHDTHCRIYIERNDPYPTTITEKFWCKDTGYLGE